MRTVILLFSVLLVASSLFAGTITITNSDFSATPIAGWSPQVSGPCPAASCRSNFGDVPDWITPAESRASVNYVAGSPGFNSTPANTAGVLSYSYLNARTPLMYQNTGGVIAHGTVYTLSVEIGDRGSIPIDEQGTQSFDVPLPIGNSDFKGGYMAFYAGGDAFSPGTLLSMIYLYEAASLPGNKEWGTWTGVLDTHVTSVAGSEGQNLTIAFGIDPNFSTPSQMYLTNVNLTDVDVHLPEPATFALVGLGLLGVAFIGRKRA